MIWFSMLFGLVLLLEIYVLAGYFKRYGIFGRKKGVATLHLIWQAVEKIPVGLCIALEDGYPIMTNQKMHDTISLLFGHTVVNAEELWDELCHYPAESDHAGALQERLRDSSLELETEQGRVSDRILRLPDQTVVRFRRRLLIEEGQPTYIQIAMRDITSLERSITQTERENEHLTRQIRRQQGILREIVEINNEQERLSAKMKIHDELGRCLLMTERALDGKTTESIPQMISIWERLGKNLLDASVDRSATDHPHLKELERVASLIGCSIQYKGAPPEGETAELLFYSTIREALSNAVRHAGADRLYVQTRTEADRYCVEITDNGRRRNPNDGELLLGDGLRNLQQKLEKHGASMEIRNENGVKLNVVIPG